MVANASSAEVMNTTSSSLEQKKHLTDVEKETAGRPTSVEDSTSTMSCEFILRVYVYTY